MKSLISHVRKGLLIATLLMSIACNKNTDNSVKNAQEFMDFMVTALTEPESDAQFVILKNPSLTSGFFLVYDQENRIVYAFSPRLWTEGMTFPEYVIALSNSGLTVNDNIRSVYYNGNGQYSDAYGNLYEETQSESKDLEKVAAFIEQKNLQTLSNSLVQNYGLSEERAEKVAKVQSQWKKISKSKSMTENEINIFTKELLGVDAKTVIKAQTDAATLDLLVNKAALTNHVSPEQIKDIVASLDN